MCVGRRGVERAASPDRQDTQTQTRMQDKTRIGQEIVGLVVCCRREGSEGEGGEMTVAAAGRGGGALLGLAERGG